MRIASVRSKALRRLIQDDDSRGLPADVVPKIRIMLLFLEAMAAEEELRTLPVWKPHQMVGDRRGTWALHASKNWRLTFRVDQVSDVITDLDYEDYH